MRAMVFAAAALLVWGCHAERHAEVRRCSEGEVRTVRAMEWRASELVALVELDSPVVRLRADSAGAPAAVAARRLRAAVVRRQAEETAAERCDSMVVAQETSVAQAQGGVASPRLSGWWVAAAGAAALILLSWRGSRLRR
ncbi:MAG: hypothetical protein K2L76_00145 [Muribaculaceae bacterium]|nr:hypothetical protein [Muribaculaceae bacterium]